MRRQTLILALCVVMVAACKNAKQADATGGAAADPNSGKGANSMTMAISSSAFADGTSIPKKYACEGGDVTPPLAWTGVPANAKSLALIMDDPDAPMGTWIHWVIWNIPPTAAGLPEGLPKDSSLADGTKQGKNSWPKTGYGGPCPPPGKPHRYYFRLYALDAPLAVHDNASRAEVGSAMQGHVIGQAQLMGTYGR